MKNHIYLLQLTCLSLAMFVSGCGEETKTRVDYGGAREFAPQYNNYIGKWLKRQMEQTRIALLQAESKVAKDPENDSLQKQKKGLERELAKLDFRVNRGDYFDFKKAEDVPQDLNWESGKDLPEVGDPRAVKGGVYTDFIAQFPPTLRQIGSESNHSFRGQIYDDIQIKLVEAHPVTQDTIPGVANRWAIAPDNRTVYYHIDPEATYSDGVKIKAIDVMTAAYIRISDFITDPYYKQYYREQIAGITVYGDDIVAVTLPERKPKLEQAAALPIAPTHYYKDYGPDYEKFYQWKVPPSSAAYYVKEDDINKGVSITLTRVKDWWAKDKKYYKYRFNPDKIVYLVVRDPNKAFELFRSGKIDAFNITAPKYWYEKSEMEPVFKGYIERYKYYTQYPRIPIGIYMNVSQSKMKDLNVRLGIQHSLNWDKVIDVIYRGDFDRLQRFSEGYGQFSNMDIKAREYSVVKAREYFTKAGYTEKGEDGILMKPDKTRLSVSVTFGNSPTRGDMMALLEEDAKKAGLELRLDGLERTVSYQKVMKKQHEMTFWGWGVSPPYPRYYQFFHSKNAVDEKGNAKPSTNNINSYANTKMDEYSEAMRNARTEEEIRENCIAAQKLLWDEAIFSPGYATNYLCFGSWRWVRWPDSDTTVFNAPVIYDALENYVFWIDGDKKAETKAAMRKDVSFPEVQRTIDLFRDGIPEKFKKPTK